MNHELGHQLRVASRRVGVLVPSPPVIAEVRYASPSGRVPRNLRGKVAAVDTAAGPDFVLAPRADGGRTDATERAFRRWRSAWVHSETLDTSSSVLELAELFDDGRTAHAWATSWLAGDPAPVADPLLLCDQLASAHVMVIGRSAPAIGFVDASRPTRGLARAWSSVGGRELLCVDATMLVEADPVHGLCVTTRDDADDPLVGVVEVVTVGGVVHIVALGRERRVDADLARPLAWLVPGSTHWRVRPIPEALVYAKTFHRLREACLGAAVDRLPVTLQLGR